MLPKQLIADRILLVQNTFGILEQARELLLLTSDAMGSKYVGLLFSDEESDNLSTICCQPDNESNPLLKVSLPKQSSLVQYLGSEKISFSTRKLIELAGPDTGAQAALTAAAVLAPLISRDRIVGVLVLGEKHSGVYLDEELAILTEISNRVAASLEKEYLQQRANGREQELLALNRLTTIITSSLNIPEIFGGFIRELNKILEVNLAALVVKQNNKPIILSTWPDADPSEKSSNPISIGTKASAWLATHNKSVVARDTKKFNEFVSFDPRIKDGIKTVICLPLSKDGETFGSLILTINHPRTISKKEKTFLKNLISQISMPVFNSNLYAEVDKKSRVDELTGLLNRRSMDEVIASEINRGARYGGAFSLIIFDMDNFKEVNDTLGHLTGDKLLREIGAVTRKVIRTSDQAFRYGGDEMAILLPNTTINEAATVAERLRSRIASRQIIDNLTLTASIGVANWPDNGKIANQVIEAADKALYLAKGSGGNQVRYA